MTARRRPSLLPWTVALNAIALLLLIAPARELGAPPRTTPIALPPSPALQPGQGELVAPTAPTELPPEKTVIKRQVLRPNPGPNIAPLPPPPQPWPWLSTLPAPRMHEVAPPTPPDPLVAPVAAALANGQADLTTGARTLRLSTDPAASGAGTVIADLADAPAGTGWQRLPGDDRLWRQPHNLSAWQADSGQPELWLDATGRRLWLPPTVRAGLRAERAEALDLLRNALADPRLAAAGN